MKFNRSLIIEKTNVASEIVGLMKNELTKDTLTHEMLNEIIKHCEALKLSDF